MHSWRVLLLPFLNEQALYNRYDFTEPWDGPNNSRLVADLGRIGTRTVYSCPADPSTADGRGTNYVVITGPRSVFDDAHCTRLTEIVDEPTTTLMVVEAVGTGIQWMEPRDLSLSTMDFTVGAPTGKNISSNHALGPHGLSVAGTLLPLNSSLTKVQLRAMTTIDGGGG